MEYGVLDYLAYKLPTLYTVLFFLFCKGIEYFGFISINLQGLSLWLQY